ncbi:NAD(P)/FAD-dependent oxidoreductase [Sulfurospirillum sp. 1307]
MIYDVIVIGAGACGIMSAISAARDGKKVLLLEKLPKIGAKLKATGGGKCNLTNTLGSDDFIKAFGKNGRFMRDVINAFSNEDLIKFLNSIGLQTDCKDGFRVFPSSHNSTSVLAVFENELKRLHVEIQCNCSVKKVEKKENIFYVDNYEALHVIIATGGLGYPKLGANGDGYRFASHFGHKITTLAPAMMPLFVREKWVQNCTADTIARAIIWVDLPKYKKLKAVGDLIFTKNGIRGPVVLDFAREITPLLDKFEEVPICVNMIQGMSEDDIIFHLKKHSDKNILESISKLIPQSVVVEMLNILNLSSTCKYKQIEGKSRDKLVKILAKTPLHVIGHDGFEKAMITRGGVSLKEIDPKTMQSKLVKGLYFCGEVVDLDGPCGGYNLQWSFSSGYVASKLLS